MIVSLLVAPKAPVLSGRSPAGTARWLISASAAVGTRLGRVVGVSPSPTSRCRLAIGEFPLTRVGGVPPGDAGKLSYP